MSAPAPKAVRRGPKRRAPESEFYDFVKGQRIFILTISDRPIRGTLAWVDRYTLGVDVTRDDGRVKRTLVNKANIATLEKDD